MSSRYVPYATTPGRLLSQLISDTVVVLWSTVWVFVGLAVHSAVSSIAEVGRRLDDGATGVSDNLNSAGDSTGDVPLIGDALSKPLRDVQRRRSCSSCCRGWSCASGSSAESGQR
jgi:hypothetical protein